jgi:hypothetical protein
VTIIPLHNGVGPVACRPFQLCWASVDWVVSIRGVQLSATGTVHPPQHMCALEKESPTSPLQLVSRRHQVRLATSFDISTFLWC